MSKLCLEALQQVSGQKGDNYEAPTKDDLYENLAEAIKEGNGKLEAELMDKILDVFEEEEP